jgi:hypothetical protein
MLSEAKGEHVKRLMGLFPFIGIIMFVVAEAIEFGRSGTTNWQSIAVMNAVMYLIGAQAFAAGLGHMMFGPPVAASIGWAPSPFQWEVGGANLGIGVAGVIASSFHPDYWLAVIIVSMVFLWVAGIGHIREVVKNKNFAPNNAGPILFMDFLLPAACLVAWIAWARP